MKARHSLALLLIGCLAGFCASAARGAAVSRLTVVFTYTIGPGPSVVELTALVPHTLPGRQHVLAIRYSVPPASVFDKNGNRYARFILPVPRETSLTVTADMELERHDLDTLAAHSERGLTEPPGRLSKYKLTEKYLEANDPTIRSAAKPLRGADDVKTLRNIMAFVVARLKYTGYDPADHGAVWALKEGHGDCSEYTDLFIALCRASGIPARNCEGYVANLQAPTNITPKHAWVEAYLAPYGWVQFDPSWVARRLASPNHLAPVYLYLDFQRSNGALNQNHYFAYHWKGAPSQVHDSFEVKPLVPSPK